jgi:4-hydroxy-tetrahydrodipicolinate synthase
MELQGSYVAIVTPMQPDGSLALDHLVDLLDVHLDGPTAGIVVAGTTGEAATLDDAEYQQLVAACVTHVAGRKPVIAGIGAPSTGRVLELAALAHQAGADAALCVTPYYLRTTQDGLFQHYTKVADAAGLPILLYNVPVRTGIDLLPSTVARLAGHPNIVALKEAVAGPQRIRELREQCGDELLLLSGDDSSCSEAMLAGAAGVISVSANVIPEAIARLCELSRDRQAYDARELAGRLHSLHELLMAEPNPIPVKWVLRHLGWIPSGIRLPLVPASEGLRERLKSALVAVDELLLNQKNT